MEQEQSTESAVTSAEDRDFIRKVFLHRHLIKWLIESTENRMGEPRSAEEAMHAIEVGWEQEDYHQNKSAWLR